MKVSAEIRWFWKDAPPGDLEGWFRDGKGNVCPAGGGESRVDTYLRDAGQDQLGLKIRGKNTSGVEVKGLVAARFGGLEVEPFVGAIELWTKWSLDLTLPADRTIEVEKQRWLRKFDTGGSKLREIALDELENPLEGEALPDEGCNVELTRITLPQDGSLWWTLGFESFGTIQGVEGSLRKAAKELSDRLRPDLAGGLPLSYPAWLKKKIL